MGYIWGMSSTTNDPQGEYIAKAEANAMDRIRSVAKEAASKAAEMMIAWASVSERVVGNENILLSIKEHTDAHDKATEQAKRKEFEAIERNEYDEIMNAQEDADEAKYGEQPKREPMLSNGEIQAMREVEYKMDGTDIAIIKRYAYLDGAMDARRWFRSKIDSGELIRREP